MELRCQAKTLYGKVSDNAVGKLEVRCRGSWCGYRPGVVVLHTFDLSTGKVEKTERFSDPSRVFQQAKTKKRSVS